VFQPEPLFKKIDASQIQQLKAKFGGQQSKVSFLLQLLSKTSQFKRMTVVTSCSQNSKSQKNDITCQHIAIELVC